MTVQTEFLELVKYVWIQGKFNGLQGILRSLSDRSIGVFSKWNRKSLNSVNSWNLINHRSMNWTQFKDPVSHMCLAGSVVASWSLTLEVARLQVWTLYCIDKYFCHWIQWKHLGKASVVCWIPRKTAQCFFTSFYVYTIHFIILICHI